MMAHLRAGHWRLSTGKEKSRRESVCTADSADCQVDHLADKAQTDSSQLSTRDARAHFKSGGGQQERSRGHQWGQLVSTGTREILVSMRRGKASARAVDFFPKRKSRELA